MMCMFTLETAGRRKFAVGSMDKPSNCEFELKPRAP